MNKEQQLYEIITRVTGFTGDLNPQMNSDCIPGWDSISHLFIISEIESVFNKKFTVREIESWDIILDILNSLD